MSKIYVWPALIAALSACGDGGAVMTEGTGSSTTDGSGELTSSPTSAATPGTASDPTEGPAPSTTGPTSDPTATGEPTTGDPTTGDLPDPPPPPSAICDVPVELVDTADPTTVVGDGTPASCDEAALADAVAAGGLVTFDCGGPVTITLSKALKVTKDLVLDGAHQVTLSGGGVTRILDMDTGNFEAQGPALTVQRLRFIDGRASGTAIPLGTDIDGGGGAIFHRGGSVTAIDCQFENNEAATWGPDVAGGAIYGIGVGATTIVGSTFHGNRAANGGAVGSLHTALTIVNSTFTANEATGRDANYINMFGEQAGHGGNGGALVMDGVGRELTICGSTFAGNKGGAFGAALFRTGYEGEPTLIDRSTFADNEIPDHDDPDSPSSGALYIQGTHVELTNSTISGNRARSSAGVWILGHGNQPAVANLTNVTITGNATWPKADFTTRGIGAGVTIGHDTTGTILNCTIVGNDAQFGAGILRVSPLVVRNTIISNNAENQYTPLNCTGASYNQPPGSGEHNLQWPTGPKDDMDCTPGITRADPMLGELADHGGPTLTIAPLPGSPALAAGSDCPEFDQRGEPRNQPCTLGAYEAR